MFWIGTKSMIGTEIVLGRLMPMHPGRLGRFTRPPGAFSGPGSALFCLIGLR